MKELVLTGGARIGMANATFPFATLRVNKEKLELNASILGNLTFHPSDIISIEPYTMIPLLGQGVKINHNVPFYKNRVIFWSFKNPNSLVKEIQETGFLDNTNHSDQTKDQSIIERQAKGGFPIKTWFVILAIVVWNVFILLDFFGNDSSHVTPGIGSKVALGFMFGSGLLLLISEQFRQLVLKEGRSIDDIKKFVYLILVITGIMLLI